MKEAYFPSQSYQSKVSLDPKIYYKTQSSSYDRLLVTGSTENPYEGREAEYKAHCRESNRQEKVFVDMQKLLIELL